VQIQSRLHDVEKGNEDQPVWNCSKNGQYSCSETWEAVRFLPPMVSWWKMVWFNLSIPRHAFISWLVARNALSTGENLLKWGYVANVLCLFCRGSIEGGSHMFFHCSFTRHIWQEVMSSNLIRNPQISWDEVVVFGAQELKECGLKTSLCQLSLGAVVYNLWKHHNDIKHGNTPIPHSLRRELFRKIKWEIRTRILSKGIQVYKRELGFMSQLEFTIEDPREVKCV
jgi:hypothetical protein